MKSLLMLILLLMLTTLLGCIQTSESVNNQNESGNIVHQEQKEINEKTTLENSNKENKTDEKEQTIDTNKTNTTTNNEDQKRVVYSEINQSISIDNFTFTLNYIEGTDKKTNISISVKNKGTLTYMNVKKAILYMRGNFTINGLEKPSFEIEKGEKTFFISFPANPEYIEKIFLSIDYRIPLQNKLNEEGTINITYSLTNLLFKKANIYIYIPKQCEEEPWGNDPKSYYEKKGVVVENVKTERIADAVCFACNICPKGYVWKLYVKKGGNILINDGWEPYPN